jgi:16S rRNA (cytosine967-C5)-methyltransferase
LPDPARRVAYDLLRAVSTEEAYANLLLPRLIEQARLDRRDAALATELGYGALRAQGTLDEILGSCVDRPLSRVEPAVLDLLRLGAYQLLRMRVPSHAAVSVTVELARETGSARAAGFVNAVLRRVAAMDWDAWTDRLAGGRGDLAHLALRTAHPLWIAEAFAEALSGDLEQVRAALVADDARPRIDLVAWPGRVDRAELADQSHGAPTPWSPYGVRLVSGGDPARLAAVRDGRAAVQDEGSQLCALAFAQAPLAGRDERWLDLCAGPGGKTALLAGLARSRNVQVTANELHPHRARLVRDAVRRATASQRSEPGAVEVITGDARELPATPGGYDRVLLDAPCSGLGALRRRPEARWRKRPDEIGPLSTLQRQLLAAALRLVRPGGLVAYVTCSPHLAETTEVVADHQLIDARPAFPGVPDLGDGRTVQLWPHRHGTDALFCALLPGQ